MRFLIKTILAFSAVSVLLCSHNVFAQDQTAKVKAVFLFKFADYVTWPEGQKPAPGGTFSMCVWGAHPFGKTLDVIARKQKNYTYKIRYISSDKTPKNCHLLFTEKSSQGIPQISGAFLVGDSRGFARQGGMVELAERSGKVKLVGNLAASEEAGFKISARLLDIMHVMR